MNIDFQNQKSRLEISRHSAAAARVCVDNENAENERR
jgi:hypothetical protein